MPHCPALPRCRPTSRRTAKADIDKLMTQLSNRGRWGKTDEIGAMNLITPARRTEAAPLVATPADPWTPPASRASTSPASHGSKNVMSPILDNCDPEALSTEAAKRNRLAFLLTASPLSVKGGTGSPSTPSLSSELRRTEHRASPYT